MTAMWVSTGAGQERLIIARRVRVGESVLAQGIALNWDALQRLLLAEVVDLFPKARLQRAQHETPLHPERTMTALPVEFLPGESATAIDPGWSPLRLGLALAWVAALVALAAVGLGGWSLIDFSQRRVGFVSAVTHELRTPLTTLRLYLDMLSGGMVREERQREEYLLTLNNETDRLNRLVSNVLDFSRLERQRPKLELVEIRLDDLLGDLAAAWEARCQECGKHLIVDNQLGAEATLVTDKQLLQQILGNLIDNGCKYSRDAQDKRMWLRARRHDRHSIAIEVEDCGPGVERRERRSIFRPFQRGKKADVTAAGVGLGLALACRWAHLLKGKLSVCAEKQAGACFRLLLRG
jgi:signal transduction histidine kinase